MVDRFQEFNRDLERPAESAESEYHAVEMRPLTQHSQPTGVSDEGFMENFYRDVGEIKSGITRIKESVTKLGNLLEKQLSAVKKADEQHGQVQEIVDSTNRDCMVIKTKLKEMEKLVSGEQDDKSAQARIRRNTYGTLSKQFVEVMTNYQEKQDKFKTQIREKAARQLRIVNPTITEEETTQAIEQGSGSIFVNALASKHSRAYTEVCERHKEILRLEASIQELHQLFVDMSILVEAQGELLNQIEYSVSQSVAYTEQAKKELKEGAKLQKKSRKKMCILMIVFLILIIVIVAPLMMMA